MDEWINYFLITLLALCAASDVRSNKIFNIVTVPFAITAVALHTFSSGLDGFLFSAAGLATGIFNDPLIF